jgi:hypothetical protein
MSAVVAFASGRVASTGERHRRRATAVRTLPRDP